MKISIISDEISFDFHTAYELGLSWGCTNFELRKLGPDRIPDHDPVWEDVVGQYIADGRAAITALSPGLFKLKRSSEFADSHINARFQASLDLAVKFKCPRIIIFGFMHEDNEDPADPPQEVIEILQTKADQAAKAGIELSVETSQATFARNGSAHRTLLDRIARENVTTNWDPTNAITDGDTSPLQGFEEVAGTVGQVHIKDTRDGNIIVVGEGIVDWAGQLAALQASGFNGCLTLETHLKPRLTETKKCLDNLRKIAEQYLD